VDKPGLASLTADMLDEGTTHRTALQIAEELSFIGARFSTGAGWDAAGVNLTTLTKHLDQALEILADVVLHPSFPENELERLRKDRLTSLMQQKDQPTVVASNVFAKVLYGEHHPYGQPTLGTEASLQGITRQDLESFYRTYFHPNNAALIVVGDVKPEDLTARLEKVLGGWTKGEFPPPGVPTPPKRGGTQIFLVDKPKAAQSEIRVGLVGVPRPHPDYFPLLVMNTVLGGQFSSRLNLNLREAKGYTYGARSFFDFRKGPGPFVASAGVKTAVTDSSVIEFMNEIRRIRDEALTPQELEFAKATLIRRLPAQFETPAQIAGQLAALVLYDLPDDYFDTYVQRVNAVSVADVQRVAKQYLDPEHLAIVIVGDVATIREGLAKLGYGVPVLLDAEGRPVSGAEAGSETGARR